MKNTTSIQFFMRAGASTGKEGISKMMEHFEFAELLVLLTKEGNFRNYTIEGKEQEEEDFYVDLFFSDMEVFKKEKDAFNELSGVFLECQDGELVEFKSLESYGIVELAVHFEDNTVFYDPITLKKIEED